MPRRSASPRRSATRAGARGFRPAAPPPVRRQGRRPTRRRSRPRKARLRRASPAPPEEVQETGRPLFLRRCVSRSDPRKTPSAARRAAGRRTVGRVRAGRGNANRGEVVRERGGPPPIARTVDRAVTARTRLRVRSARPAPNLPRDALCCHAPPPAPPAPAGRGTARSSALPRHGGRGVPPARTAPDRRPCASPVLTGGAIRPARPSPAAAGRGTGGGSS